MRKQMLFVLGLMVIFGATASAQEEGSWPRQFSRNGNELFIYQPQLDSWKDRLTLEGRVAAVVIPKDADNAASGALWIKAKTDTDKENRTVLIYDVQITKTRFSLKNPQQAEQAERLAQELFPKAGFTMSLDSLLAALAHSSEKPASSVSLDNTPPKIFVSERPARLLLFDGKPTFSPITDTDLVYAINTNWALFLESGTSRYYLLDRSGWLTAAELKGPWTYTSQLPTSFSKLPDTDNWQNVKEKIPAPPIPPQAAPRIFESTTPAELIVLAGTPEFVPIPDTKLFYVKNTESLLFWYSRNANYYYLVAGRWFRASSLDGPWTFTSYDLPTDFAKIPPHSQQGIVLSSVPNTPEAREAVFQAEIPQVAVIDRKEVKATVTYVGKPEFKPISGTAMDYAVNTPNDVIKVGQIYYLCENGVWFSSPSPNGPWVVVDQVPQEIYTIPPSSPVYHVTYVNVYESTPTTVVDGYTAGYLGGFITAGLLFWGTGYYYPPFIAVGWARYPIFYPRLYTYGCGAYYNPITGRYFRGGYVYGPYGGIGAGAVYNPITGRYARGAAVYGPYGGAGAWQSYNPRTGMYARGGAAYGPYGAGRAFQAYNPRTGTYAAGYRRSNPYASWGRGVVSRGSQWAKGGYYSNARGTVGGFHTSKGSEGAGYRGSGGQSGGFIHTAGGGLYADHDGNVYRRQDGSWQKYNNGGWSPVQRPERTGSQADVNRPTPAEPRAGTEGVRDSLPGNPGNRFQGLERDFAARQRGAWNSDRFANWRSGGDLGGRFEGLGNRFGGGRFGGFGRR